MENLKKALFVVLIWGALALAACGAEPTVAPTKTLPTTAPTQDTTFESPLNMPNPASVYCEEQGYTLEIRDEAGGQVGYCLFLNGAECEEWAFFRGECAVPETYP